jgi:hypothetical protein
MLRDHSAVTVVAEWPAGRAAARVARSRTAVASTRRRIEDWLADRGSDARYALFGTHFEVLGGVLARMMDRIDESLMEQARAVSEGEGSGEVYRRCAELDRRTTLVGRIFDWYAPKYDQRRDADLADVLLAADEVVRSCWTQPFAATGRRRPTGPLVYLDPRFDAVATPRTSVPADLRAPGDELVGELVTQLAIPVVALPAIAVAEPWWLVLAAHETAHHVQQDLSPTLVEDTRSAVLAAASMPPGDAEVAASWTAWIAEAFADAFAALAIGPAAAWAVEELQHGPAATLTRPPRPGERYPPPVVRTALLGELARCAGAADPGPSADDVIAWLDTYLPAQAPAETMRTLLATVPQVAAALVSVSVDGVPLSRLTGWQSGYLAARGDVQRWSAALADLHPVIVGRADPAAARIGIAAAVVAYRQANSQPEALRILATNVPAVLKTCGPPGTLAGTPTVDVEELADRLADRLFPPPDEAAG